jgi:hypothetical protein
MTQQLSNADAALKEFYLPTMRVQINQNFDLLQAVCKNTEDFEGRRAVLSLHTGRSGGVGAGSELQDLPDAGYQRSAEERIGVHQQRARIQLSVDVMKSMKSDQGSFTRAMELETSGIVNDSKFDVARQLMGTSDGVIAACTSNASQVITLTSPTQTQMRMFYKNMRVDVGTVANPVLKGANLTISAVNRAAGTITVVGTLGTVANTDRVFRAGAGGSGANQKEVTGLPTIVNDSGTLFNIDPTVDPEWVSLVDANGGTPRAATENLFEKMMDNIFVESGEDPDAIWTSFGVQRNYAAAFKGLRQFDAPPVKLAGGFEAPSITTPRGTIGFVADRFNPEGTAFVVNTAHLIEFILDDWDFMDEDGAVLSRVSGKAAYEAALLKFHELATDKRNAHGRIVDLTES